MHSRPSITYHLTACHLTRLSINLYKWDRPPIKLPFRSICFTLWFQSSHSNALTHRYWCVCFDFYGVALFQKRMSLKCLTPFRSHSNLHILKKKKCRIERGQSKVKTKIFYFWLLYYRSISKIDMVWTAFEKQEGMWSRLVTRFTLNRVEKCHFPQWRRRQWLDNAAERNRKKNRTTQPFILSIYFTSI